MTKQQFKETVENMEKIIDFSYDLQSKLDQLEKRFEKHREKLKKDSVKWEEHCKKSANFGNHSFKELVTFNKELV